VSGRNAVERPPAAALLLGQYAFQATYKQTNEQTNKQTHGHRQHVNIPLKRKKSLIIILFWLSTTGEVLLLIQYLKTVFPQQTSKQTN